MAPADLRALQGSGGTHVDVRATAQAPATQAPVHPSVAAPPVAFAPPANAGTAAGVSPAPAAPQYAPEAPAFVERGITGGRHRRRGSASPARRADAARAAGDWCSPASVGNRRRQASENAHRSSCARDARRKGKHRLLRFGPRIVWPQLETDPLDGDRYGGDRIGGRWYLGRVWRPGDADRADSPVMAKTVERQVPRFHPLRPTQPRPR